MESVSHLDAAQHIGGFELLRRIGRGGMAEVWVAKRVGAKRKTKYVAVKLIASHLAGQERYSRMFQAEAELSALLSHSNIVQVFDEGEENGRSFLVMEWVDGINFVKLRAGLGMLGDDPQRFSIAAHVIGQLLHALSYAHNITTHEGHPLGIVHRDVSPQNVLVSNSGDVKLTDFGVARHAYDETSGLHIKGKIRYMSPEQIAGKPAAPTVDLYAAGAILHELLEGEKFRGDFTDDRVLHAQVLGGVIPELSKPVPQQLEALRRGLLEPDPGKRLQTADDALRILREYDGYRDMRIELGRICGSLTGVIRPRTGPGVPSSGPTAAATSRPHAAARPAAMSGELADTHTRAVATGECVPEALTQEPELLAEPQDPRRPSFEDSTHTAFAPAVTTTSEASVVTVMAAPQRRSLAIMLGTIAIGMMVLGTVAALLFMDDDDSDRRFAAQVIALDAEAAENQASATHPMDPAAAAPLPSLPAGTVAPNAAPPDPSADAANRAPAQSPTRAPTSNPSPLARMEATPNPAAKPKANKARPSTHRSDADGAASKESSEPPPSVPVHFRVSGIEQAELKIGPQAFDLRPGGRRSTRIVAGTYPVSWRPSGAVPWTSVGKLVFAPNHDWVIRIDANGPTLTEVGAKGR